MAFKPSLRRRREEESTELNITPIMNLMVVLIPLLISTAKFTELALLEYLPPAAAEEGGGGGEGNGGDENQVQNLSLLLNLVDESIQVSMYGKVEPGPNFYEIPNLPDGNYDWDTLSDSLWSIKQREVGEATGLDSTFDETSQMWQAFPTYKVADGREVSITAVATTRFQTVIKAMDVCKSRKVGDVQEELFPIAILKQFQ